MTTAKTKLLTAADLLRLDSEGVRGELVRGVLHETMSAGQEHGEIVMNISSPLWTFVKAEKLGRVMGSDSGVWLERDPDTVREPDIAYFSAEKAPPFGVRVMGYSEIVPDLVVEVASPNDSLREVREKALMWLSYGARLVWAAHPNTRTVDVYRSNGECATLGEGDTLDGADVLPGFTCAVSDVFAV